MSLRVDRPEEPLSARHRRLLGSRTGFISDFYLSHRARGDPEAFLTVPQMADFAGLVGIDGELDLGVSGKGTTLSAALTTGLGEAIERYCLCWPPARESLETASYDDRLIDGNPIEWRYLDVYTADQRGDTLAPLSVETPLLWTTGRNLLTGESVSVPAELVWMRVGSLETVPQHFPASSNGTAAGIDLEDAIGRAIYECIERDAFMRMWCRQEPPTELSVPESGPIAEALARVDRRTLSARVFAYDSPVDVPTVGATLTNDRDERPTFVTGGSAARRPPAAIADALNEVAQGWPYANYMATQHDLEALDAAAAVDNFDENVLYYSQPEHESAVSFMFEGEMASIADAFDIETAPDRSDLQFVLSALSEAGCTPIAFDLTTRDAAAAGIAVARVVIPELVPLTPPAILPRAHPAFDGEQVTEKPHPYP
ncbi:YcaO-like family protein [Halalkalirubrum salinum]|uniref:YcaO-like family protein n=1 Tax=Halalkalirubrum salinum TaxID=2563889 RepID=UPI0010FB7ED1|nr:YcaO-like family protein [Halalkalirubrum salinum]